MINRCNLMTDWPIILLIMEGIPFLAFIYYLEYKKRMRLLDMEVPKDDPLEVRLERRLTSGLFLSLAGASIITSPAIARIAGMEVGLTFELLIMGIVILSAGLAMLLGYGILKGRSAYSSGDALEFK